MVKRIKDDIKNLKLLGSGSLPSIGKSPDKSMLECFANQFSSRLYIVNFVFPEFTSLCPVTGQPDFGTISIEYIPDKLCIESKSFKLYMFAYRNYPSFMETITNVILEDMCAVLSPFWCRVKGEFVPRGGVKINVFAEEFKKISKDKLNDIKEVVNNWKNNG